MKRYRRTLAETVRWRVYGKWQQKLLRRRAKYRFRRALKKAPTGAIAIDCGANVGDVTEVLVQHGLKVIAFEPDPMAIEVFRRRFRDDSRITLHECAVGAAPGSGQLHRSARAAADLEYSQHSSLFGFDHLERDATATVPIIDIVQALKDIDGRIYIMKLDIEGAEAEVLEALLDANCTTSVDHIFVETHERFGAEIKSRIDALRTRIALGGHKNIDLNWG